MTIHATCVRLDRAGLVFGAPRDAGILLLGNSGAGKSDVALRLIALGAKLVADDRTELFVEKGKLYGRAPKSIAGLLEIRGVGILKIPSIKKARIMLAIKLVNEKMVPRLPPRQYYNPSMPELPKTALIPLLSLSAGHSAPEKILAATAGFSRDLFRD